MQNLHIEKIKVNDTNLNFKMQLNLTEVIRFLQVATFNHSNNINLDHKTMQEKSNAFWVITKLKVKLKKEVTSGEILKVATWTQPLTAIRAIRDFKIKSGNKVVASASAEWCCLDMDTHRIRKLSSIAYPDLEMVETSSSGVMFTNLNKEYCKKHYVYSRVIRSSDIDINQHTNNLKYNSMAFDALSVEELSSINIKEYEIHFANESKENDVVDIYKIKEKNNYFIEGITKDKIIFKVAIKYSIK